MSADELPQELCNAHKHLSEQYLGRVGCIGVGIGADGLVMYLDRENPPKDVPTEYEGYSVQHVFLTGEIELS